MKKQVSIILSTLIVSSMMLSTVTGCGIEDTTEYLTLDSYMQSINEKNLEEAKADATFDEADYLLDYDNADFKKEDMSESGEKSSKITKEIAKKDIETLFKVLKHRYAGYTYFGGDERFGQAKSEIINSIDSSNKNTFKKNDLTEMILSALSFVYDSHFTIDGRQTFNEAHTYHESAKMEFYKDSKGYYTKIDEEIWYLPTELEKYLKVTIGKSGELVYGIFAVVLDQGTLPKEAELYNNSKKNKVNLNWIVSEVGGDQSSISEYTEVNGVAISSLSNMDPSAGSIQIHNEFLNNSKKHAEKENSILDLRDNTGGVADFDFFWAYGYTGEIVDFNWKQQFYLDDDYLNYDVDELTKSFLELDIVKNNTELKDFYSKAVSNKYVKNQVIFIDGNFDVNIDNLANNKNKLFVLQGKRCYSSGEYFIELLHNIENVLTVGTNTNGCIHTGVVSMLNLPNIRLRLTFSQGINIGPDKEIDIYGIEPDIYIASEDAQDAVLRCIEYYKQK